MEISGDQFAGELVGAARLSLDGTVGLDVREFAPSASASRHADAPTPDPPSRSPPRSPVWPYLLAVLLFFAYAAWMLGPYLKSIVVRDAAVTSWSHVATAPNAGQLTAAQLEVGRAVGAAGIIRKYGTRISAARR